VDLKKRKADRLRVMQAIYDATGGSELVLVSGPGLQSELGLSQEDMADVCMCALHSAAPLRLLPTLWGRVNEQTDPSQVYGCDREARQRVCSLLMASSASFTALAQVSSSTQASSRTFASVRSATATA
jgi:hypothetical protein